MSIPEPTAEELNRLIRLIGEAGWLKAGTIACVDAEVGKWNFQLSEQGVAAFVGLHRILMVGPDEPNNDGVYALLWLLDDCQKKHRPNG